MLIGLSLPEAHAGSAAWKKSLRAARLADSKAAVPSTASAPHSRAAWKVALQKPGYAKTIWATKESALTTVKLAREQAQWAKNPTAFTHAHPNLGKLFAEQKALQQGVAASSLHGTLTSTAYDYYRWRRSLDPARFDINHPNLGPLLAEDQVVHNLITTPPATTIPYVPPTSPGDPGGPPAGIPGGDSGGVHVAVPEPSTYALLLIGSGALLAANARRKLLASRG